MEFIDLISSDDLNSCLGMDDVVVFDCRYDLTRPGQGRKAYNMSHIPGAIFASVSENLSDLNSKKKGRHPLPDPSTFLTWLSEKGVDHDKQLIAYDSSGGIYGSRFWWMLRQWLGFPKVAVLDGGWQGWLERSYEVTASPAPPRDKTNFKSIINNVFVDEYQILEKNQCPQLVLIDARSKSRFRGIGETLDPIGGHIPGAINRYYENNLSEDGYFKSRENLRNEFETLIGSTSPSSIVHTCGSGISACHNLLAMEVAGLSGSQLYPGSWSAWVSDPERPVEK